MRLAIAVGAVLSLSACGASPGGTAAKPYTGRLKIDHGTEYVLEETASRAGGACEGWKTMSLQRPGQPSSGMRDMLCWRASGDMILVTGKDGQRPPAAPRAIYTD